jgi:hypothetical protein
MARNRMGVEVVGDQIVSVSLRGGTVADTRSVTMPPPSAKGGTNIAALVGQRRIGGAPVHLALCDTEHVHRTVLLPPMTAAEQDEVIRRETAREGEDAKAAAWRVMRELELDGLPKTELLVVMAPPARLDAALGRLTGGGLEPRLVVTGPLALLGAARALSPSPIDRPTAIVHWGVATLTIVVVSEGVLKFARVVEPPAGDLDPFDWIPVEIDRSIRHYAFVSKGERVEQVMLSVAGAAAARRLFSGGELAERLRLTVTNLDALLAPALPARAETGLAAGLFTLAYGAAVLDPKDVPNLLPPAIAFQRRSRNVIAASVAASLALLVFYGTGSLATRREARTLRSQISSLEVSIQGARARDAVAAQDQAERDRVSQLSVMLTDDPLKVVPPADVFREFGRLVPGPLRLDQVTFTADGQGYVLGVNGRIEQDDLTDAQRTLHQFFVAMRQSPLFHGVEIRQSARAQSIAAPAAAPDDPAGPAPAAQPAPVPPLMFVITARLRGIA